MKKTITVELEEDENIVSVKVEKDDGVNWFGIFEKPFTEVQPASLESLIERVEGLIENKDVPNEFRKWYVLAIKDAINILRTTPCITAKALRKKGTDEWYFYHNRRWLTTNKPIPLMGVEPISIDGLLVTPSDAELVPIQILIP